MPVFHCHPPPRGGPLLSQSEHAGGCPAPGWQWSLSPTPGAGAPYVPTPRLQSLRVTQCCSVGLVGPRKREVHFSAPLGLCIFILLWALQIP